MHFELIVLAGNHLESTLTWNMNLKSGLVLGFRNTQLPRHKQYHLINIYHHAFWNAVLWKFRPIPSNFDLFPIFPFFIDFIKKFLFFFFLWKLSNVFILCFAQFFDKKNGIFQSSVSVYSLKSRINDKFWLNVSRAVRRLMANPNRNSNESNSFYLIMSLKLIDYWLCNADVLFTFSLHCACACVWITFQWHCCLFCHRVINVELANKKSDARK